MQTHSEKTTAVYRKDSAQTLKKEMTQVNDFMRKVGAPDPAPVTEYERRNFAQLGLKNIVDQLHTLSGMAKRLFKTTGDQRTLRADLMIEEMEETIKAMADQDELELLDGLADLMYVVIGTALQFDLPLGYAFDEVHRSNMTKSTARQAACNHTGDKGKGRGYVAPDLLSIMQDWRSV